MNRDKFKSKTFDEIAGKYGEDAAINAGIAADPDTYELDEEWIKEARPASEVIPDIVERYQLFEGERISRYQDNALHTIGGCSRGAHSQHRPRVGRSGEREAASRILWLLRPQAYSRQLAM